MNLLKLFFAKKRLDKSDVDFIYNYGSSLCSFPAGDSAPDKRVQRMNMNRFNISIIRNIPDIIIYDASSVQSLLNSFSINILDHEFQHSNFSKYSFDNMIFCYKEFLKSKKDEASFYRELILSFNERKMSHFSFIMNSSLDDIIDKLPDDFIITLIKKTIIESDVNFINEPTFNYYFDYYRDIELDIINVAYNLSRLCDWKFIDQVNFLQYVGDYDGFEYVNNNFANYLRIKSQLRHFSWSSVACELEIEEACIFKDCTFMKFLILISKSVNDLSYNINYEFFGITDDDVSIRLLLCDLVPDINVSEADVLRCFMEHIPTVTDYTFKSSN